MVRNTLEHVSDKDKKAFSNDLKTIYHAADEKSAYEELKIVAEKWEKIYKNSIKRWFDNWDVISPIFKFSEVTRKVIYTTNAIENLNSQYRRLNKSRTVFPSEESLLKALYLATMKIAGKWTGKIRGFGMVYGELAIMFDGRL